MGEPQHEVYCKRSSTLEKLSEELIDQILKEVKDDARARGIKAPNLLEGFKQKLLERWRGRPQAAEEIFRDAPNRLWTGMMDSIFPERSDPYRDE